MKNNILVSRIESFIALNPEMVDAVLTDYGVSKEVPLTVETVVSAYKLFGEEFARDLYDALGSEINQAKKSKLSNTDGEVSTESDTQSSGWDWEAFFNGLNGLADATPDIINAANGNTFPHGTYPSANVPGYYPPPTTSSINILMYVAIAIAIIVTLVVVFKKA